MQYFIKKEIHARSITEALKRENKAQIIEIWTEPSKHDNLIPAIGFQSDEDEPVSGSEVRK